MPDQIRRSVPEISRLPDHETRRWFVLQTSHETLGHPIAEARFQVGDLAALRAVIGADADDDPDLRSSYALDAADMAALAARFGVRVDDFDRPITLVPWQSVRDAPYLNHTGFELPLMLEGRKPFAKFSDTHPSAWLDELLTRFDPYVAEGRIIRRIVREPLPERYVLSAAGQELRHVYFALPGQEWRIDAQIMLHEVCCRSGWNLALERYEGMLLGYEDWQNDWHLDKLRREGMDKRWSKGSDVARILSSA